LTGGTDDDFDACDAYSITSQGGCYEATEIRRFRIRPTLESYIKFDGEATACDHDLHLGANQNIQVCNIRIISRISFLNVQCGEAPEMRFTVWGV
jgi:hypothetical protein